MKKPLMSIIIATFNSGHTLRNALESVKQQCFQDWECIIVDGASNDNTVDVIQKYIQTDNRFKYISEPDNGIYDAFNKGWKMATGEWIYYLGSDDKLTRDGLYQLSLLTNTVSAVISGNVLAEHIDRRIKKVRSKGFHGCHQGKITRRQVMLELNGFNEKYKIIADYDLYCRMENKYEAINADIDVAYFKVGGMSQSWRNLHKIYKEYFTIRKANNLDTSFYIKTMYIIHKVGSIIYRKVSHIVLVHE